MASSVDDIADRLAKSVTGKMLQAATDGECSTNEYRQRCKDFVAGDRPTTSDPVDMASHAFCGVAISGDGQCGAVKPALNGVIAFLRDHRHSLPKHGQLLQLKSILDTPPVDVQAVHQWFTTAFP